MLHPIWLYKLEELENRIGNGMTSNLSDDDTFDVTIEGKILIECANDRDAKKKLLTYLKNPRIKGIRIVSYDVDETKRDIIQDLIPEMLEACNYLESIELWGMKINEQSADAVADKLGKCDNLQEIFLDGCTFDNPGSFRNIISKLENKTQLRKFKLRRLQDPDVQAIADVLKNKNGLEEFTVEKCGLQDDQVAIIASNIKNKQELVKFSLYSNKITQNSARSLEEALSGKPKLQILELGDNKIGPKGAEAVARALNHNVQLKNIGLSLNDITDEGVKVIAPIINNNTQLVELELAYNSIGDEGAVALAQAMKGKKIRDLVLSSNNLTEKGAAEIANVLKDDDELESLSLSRNQVGDEGAKAIAGAITGKQKFYHLSLLNNNIKADGARAIEAAAKTISGIHIHLDGNEIGNETDKQISDTLKQQSPKPNAQLAKVSMPGSNNANAIPEDDKALAVPKDDDLIAISKFVTKLVQATHGHKCLYSNDKAKNELKENITKALLDLDDSALRKTIVEIGKKTNYDELDNNQKKFLEKASDALSDNIVEINHLKNNNLFKYIGQIIWQAFVSVFYERNYLDDYKKGYKEIKSTEVKKDYFTTKLLEARQTAQDVGRTD